MKSVTFLNSLLIVSLLIPSSIMNAAQNNVVALPKTTEVKKTSDWKKTARWVASLGTALAVVVGLGYGAAQYGKKDIRDRIDRATSPFALQVTTGDEYTQRAIKSNPDLVARYNDKLKQFEVQKLIEQASSTKELQNLRRSPGMEEFLQKHPDIMDKHNRRYQVLLEQEFPLKRETKL
jgi:hypothetical protein